MRFTDVQPSIDEIDSKELSLSLKSLTPEVKFLILYKILG